ncbi:hypothetical protein [uncultured Subdoligranulum sp.]|uniref:hypothetical protein n=1 Tax=uncultured Subdoligranulum sp. TaxID=512298 RepID=UPI0025EE4327|nr:hypothetical protein [uncultured Subdoligranulum sp.]
MPSKRTNDSVDRILQDLNQQQTAAGVQDTVTDHQVDEILRSVGISTTPLHGTPEQDHKIAFSGLDDLDSWEELRSTPKTQPRQETAASVQRTAAPARTASRPQAEAPRQPVQPAGTVPQQARPAQQEPAEEPVDTGTLGDTTRTGIIKGFLLKMAPEAGADTDALNAGKNQFQKFFRDSVAVVPDENGKIREPGRKKRGLFGLKSAEDTDEFVPINVSLGGGAQQENDTLEAEEPASLPQQPQEEYFPDREPEPSEPKPAKKRGFLGGLFAGRESTTEEIVIPEARQEEPASIYHAQREVVQEPEEPQGDTVENVWRSKYTRTPVAPAASEGDTIQMLRDIKQVMQNPNRDVGATGTIYRKKRNTVEFTPGQKIRTAPPAQAMPEPPTGEPVGEPINIPSHQAPSTGFTMQLGALDAAPLDSTQDFMNAYNAVRPRTAPQASRPAEQPRQAAAPTQTMQTAPVQNTYVQAAPAQPAVQPQPQPAAQTQEFYRAPVQEAPCSGLDPNADTQVVGLPQNDSLLSRREPDDVDQLVDTLTGKIRLTPETPAHSGFTQDLGLGAAPAAESHSGFTQNLSAAAPETATTGFTQDLTGGEPAEPGTASFVHDIAQAINTGTVAGGMDRFDSAAARLTESLQEEEDTQPLTGRQRAQRLAKGMKGMIHLAGKPEDEQGDSAAQPFDTTEIPVAHHHEYERAEDAPVVRRELAQQVLYYTTASMVTGVIAAVLLVLGLMAAAMPSLPGPLADATVYPAVVLVLLVAAGGLCWRTVVSGLLGLVKRPTPDSLAILPLLGAALQCIVLLIARNYTSDVTLLAGPAVLVLCLNSIGKRMNACTVQENFRLVSAKVEHSVAYRLKDAGALRAVTNGLAEPHPSVLVNRPTQIFRSFLTNSAAAGTSDKNQQQFAWLAGGCALIAMLITLIRTKDSAAAMTVLASVLCLGAPLAGTLLSALPARMMQRSAAQVGAVIPGWRDIRQLGRINVIQVTARDLFPSGCVTLSGIKPVNPEHIDLAIVYAASILAEAGPTLREVFLSMLGENRNLLAQVDDRETVYGKGYVGWINKRRVLVGNRALMQDYGVKIPSLEYEQHHTVNQRRVIYLAVSGKLFAMFQVAYQRDPDTAVVLESLRRTGLSLVVDCDDFNCDVQLLETAYSLPAGSVKVLTAAERKTLDPAVAWLPESDGNMLHLGSFASFVGGLEAAGGAAEGEHKASVLVTASVLFGCVLGVLLTLTGGLTSLPLAALVLYQAAWCVLALIFPLIQRY